MKMENALARLLSDIGDHTVTLHALFLGDLGDDLKDMGHHGAVFRADSGNRGNVGLGDDQEVSGRLGGDVVEGEAQLVLIDLAAGDLSGNNAAEQTVRHRDSPLKK